MLYPNDFDLPCKPNLAHEDGQIAVVLHGGTLPASPVQNTSLTSTSSREGLGPWQVDGEAANGAIAVDVGRLLYGDAA